MMALLFALAVRRASHFHGSHATGVLPRRDPRRIRRGLSSDHDDQTTDPTLGKSLKVLRVSWEGLLATNTPNLPALFAAISKC